MRIARAAAILIFAAAFATSPATAQTTDGYHSIQVFPVVVDTASFTQRFTFRNPNATAVTIAPQYFPGVGTTAVAGACPNVVVPASSTLTVASLRALCPALAAGSQFGFLHTRETNAESLPFAAFSRVSNPQGNGFSVEAFPAHTFTSATSVVAGIRRLAATGGAPAFQTNCFIGNLNELAPVGSPPATAVAYTLYNAAGASLGSAQVSVSPGQLVRLLDVFAIAPAGNYPDATVKFEELGAEEPGIMAFCTVQDNTSFGADFRIAKQEFGDRALAGLSGPVVGGQDNSVARHSAPFNDGERAFQMTASVQAHTHVFYFRHPDYIQCELWDTNESAPVGPEDFMEMRLLDQDGNVLAGGNNITSWGDLYLGEKTDRNGGASTRYYIEVENTDQNFAVFRFYNIRCRSGSGHTLGERLNTEAVDRF